MAGFGLPFDFTKGGCPSRCVNIQNGTIRNNDIHYFGEQGIDMLNNPGPNEVVENRVNQCDNVAIGVGGTNRTHIARNIFEAPVQNTFFTDRGAVYIVTGAFNGLTSSRNCFYDNTIYGGAQGNSSDPGLCSVFQANGQGAMSALPESSSPCG